MSEYCSPSTSLPKMLERYQQNSGKKLWDAKHENLSAEIDRIKKENDNMQIELRHLKGEDLNSLNPKELIPIEEALQNGLSGVRDKQMDFLKMLKKNERMLEEEKKRLTYLLHHQQLAMEGSMRELDISYHQKDRDYASQLPIGVRDKQMDFLKMLKKNERMLEEENKRLTYLLHHQQLAMEGRMRELDISYHQKDRDYASQLPMSFHVQPIQTNLQGNK
ncbi:hypothetical protein HPP92_005663 [Vanilla planifolia]|uniref:K-box domain-containing protein n=1 Tax=Vanilla planifolia TaxID=51239 RepID=A0A835VCT9_VANPL|nr:hypothetical protein HPP92_005663 [Vanilla planifolia]